MLKTANEKRQTPALNKAQLFIEKISFYPNQVIFAQTGSTAILRTVSRRILADEKLRKNLTACLPI
ncbi:MAG: hypothetical protein MUD08_19030, partial [Cytophagales bacterium]|nr:hypothetical protein [Cytophagales bacterium]